MRRQIPGWLAIGWWWLLVGNFVEVELLRHFHFSAANSVTDTGTWFLTVWGLLQAGWLWSADRRSRAIFWYAALVVLDALALAADRAPFHSRPVEYFLPALLVFGYLSVAIIGILVFRLDMTRHFRETEDPGFELSWWMSLFFSDFYFQYHFHRMAEYQGSGLDLAPRDPDRVQDA